MHALDEDGGEVGALGGVLGGVLPDGARADDDDVVLLRVGHVRSSWTGMVP